MGRLTIQERQARLDREPVWVTQALWSNGTWGPWVRVGCGQTRQEAAENAENYFRDNNIEWAQGDKINARFSRRIRFKKYYLGGK